MRIILAAVLMFGVWYSVLAGSLHAQTVAGITLGDSKAKCNRGTVYPCWVTLEEERRSNDPKVLACSLKSSGAEVVGEYVVYHRRGTLNDRAEFSACISGRDFAYHTTQCCTDFAQMWARSEPNVRQPENAAAGAFGCSISEAHLKRGEAPDAFNADADSTCSLQCSGMFIASGGLVLASCIDGCTTYALNFESRAIIDRLPSCTASLP